MVDREPPAEPRPRDADATRRELLLAAQRRFVLLGYERTTTRDIADDAGVNLALINRYFGGKRGLHRAVLQNSAELLEAAATRHREPRRDVVSEFLESLDPEAWPQLGGHPLLLLLRDDEETRPMRAQALATAVRRTLVATDRADSGDPEDELRAELVLALFCGVVSLRSAGLVERLRTAEPEALRAGLEAAFTGMMGE
ncbi:TetR/AcrR family transcriptional regulator [Patulibacter minatonensis]|uniref:TetR/AcrR family transcriptional regulator n=1 Tax=Patulibacter minatonensis TaxID=298163 RepID=UPI000688B1F9|nr:TetR/AcrR family transcriptional regulator [Patulibacter minatonensis]